MDPSTGKVIKSSDKESVSINASIDDQTAARLRWNASFTMSVMMDQLTAVQGAAVNDHSSSTDTTMGMGVEKRVGDQLSNDLDRSKRLSSSIEVDDQTMVDMSTMTTTESQKYSQSIMEIAGRLLIINNNNSNPT